MLSTPSPTVNVLVAEQNITLLLRPAEAVLHFTAEITNFGIETFRKLLLQLSFRVQVEYSVAERLLIISIDVKIEDL